MAHLTCASPMTSSLTWRHNRQSQLLPPLLLSAGILIAGTQLWILLLDNSPANANTLPLVARSWAQLTGHLCLLAAVGLLYQSADMLAVRGRRLAWAVTFVGSALVAGDAWFEAVMYPLAVAHDPTIVEAAPTGPWLVGVLITFGTFTLGWTVTGLMLLRSRMVHPLAALALAGGGGASFLPLTSPHALPIAIGLVTVALSLHRRRSP